MLQTQLAKGFVAIQQSKTKVLATSLLFVMIGSLLGCGSGLGKQINSVPQAVVLTISQAALRPGASASLSALQDGVALAGGLWSVIGGSANGVIDASGTYTAPASVPADNVVTIDYSKDGYTYSQTIQLLQPIPVLSAASPNIISGTTTVTLVGKGFLPASTAVLNATPVPTAFVDSEHLTVQVTPPAANTAMVQVGVANPSPGAATSSMVAITIEHNAPVVTGVRIVDAPTIVRSETPVTLKVVGDYSDGTSSDISSSVTWTGSSSIAHVTSAGTVLCNQPGSTQVTAKAGTYAATASFSCVLKQITPFVGFTESQATFEGPFPSWVNVKTAFGAKGDGIADDTAAIQAGLTYATSRALVLWFPKGTYKISQTLHVVSSACFSVVGEDPRNTSIEWHGATGGMMISMDGSTQFRFARLSWSGLDSAAVAIHIASTLTGGQLYPTHDAIEDTFIGHVGIGIQIGFAGETTINRVHFDHNTNAGVSLEDFNALNVSVINSMFTDCQKGVTNNPGAGGYTVSNSVFVRSTVADMSIGNTTSFSIRQNMSFDSNSFFLAVGAVNGANINIQGNVIIHPASIPLNINNPGPLMLVDNTFIGLNTAQPILTSNGVVPVQIFSLENRFTTSTPFTGSSIGTVMSNDEAPMETLSDASFVAPTEIYIPSPSGRTAFDIPANAVADQIQNIVDQAAKVSGGGVVHFPAGGYQIANTITVPESSNLKLIGDGMGTILQGTGDLTGSVISISDSAMLEDLVVMGKEQPGIQVMLDDSPTSRFSCDQCVTLQGNAGIDIKQIDHASVEFLVATNDASPGTALSVTGGAARAAGLQTLGRVDAYMTSSDFYTVDNGGHLLMEDGFHDGGQGPSQFAISGNGMLTQQGGSVQAFRLDSLRVNDYSGQVSILGAQLSGALTIDASSHAHAFVAGVLQENGLFPLSDASNSSVDYSPFNYNTDNNQSPAPFSSATQQQTPSPAELEQMFSQSLTEFVPLRRTPASNTVQVALHRVFAYTGQLGMQIVPKKATGANATYTIADPQASSTSSNAGGGCPAGSVSMNGQWTLQAAGDGFVGLQQNALLLSGSPSVSASDSVVSMAAAMTDTGQRWMFKPAGNGLFKLIGRADGKALTRSTGSCAGLSDEAVDSDAQEWRISLQ